MFSNLVLHFTRHQLVLLTVIKDVLAVNYSYANILALKLSIFFVWGARGVQIVVDTASPVGHTHVTGQMPVN